MLFLSFYICVRSCNRSKCHEKNITQTNNNALLTVRMLKNGENNTT